MLLMCITVNFIFIFGTIFGQPHFLFNDIAKRLKHNKVRCTRRYSPGTCMEHNISVWSFEFQYMNCTERLGCPQSARTNRFRSYEACMSRCMPLVDLYLQILSFGTEINDPAYMRSKLENRKVAHELNTQTVSQEESTPIFDGDDPLADESVMASSIYGDNNDDGDDDDEDEAQMFEGDVDYLMETKEPDDLFEFH